jgi:hypothetical protein
LYKHKPLSKYFSTVKAYNIKILTEASERIVTNIKNTYFERFNSSLCT